MLFHLGFEKKTESRNLLVKMVGLVLRTKTTSFARYKFSYLDTSFSNVSFRSNTH